MLRTRFWTRSSDFLTSLMCCSASLMALLIFWHFSPGAMSFDSFAILSQARSGVYSDAYPPALALLWSVTDKIISGPLSILLINLLFFYGGLLLVFLWCAKRYGFIALPLFITVGLYPPITAILGVIWIDITMAAAFVAAIGVFVFFGLNEKKSGPSARIAAVFSCFLIVAGLSMRHNAAAAALPLFAFVFYYSACVKKQPPVRLAIALALGTAMTFLCFFGVRHAQGEFVDIKGEHWRGTAIYDIAGVSFREGKYLIRPSIIKDNARVDIDALYSPRSYIPLMVGEQLHALPGEARRSGQRVDFDLANTNLNKDLVENWISVITSHPEAYFRHRIDVFTSLVTRSPWGLWSTVYDVIPPNDLGIPERLESKSFYFQLVRKVARTFVFVPVYYLILSLLLVGPILYLAIKRNSTPLALAAALYASGILHMVGLFFVTASSDSRYSHWMILTTVVATAILIAEQASVSRRASPPLSSKADRQTRK